MQNLFSLCLRSLKNNSNKPSNELWYKTLANAVFPTPIQNQKLPEPPSIMAAGGPWYKEISLEKAEVMEKIKRDILKKSPKLKSIPLEEMIEKEIGNSTGESYRDYYRNYHRQYVFDIYDDATKIYSQRHEKNMQWFYSTVMLKILLHNYKKKCKLNKL